MIVLINKDDGIWIDKGSFLPVSSYAIVQNHTAYGSHRGSFWSTEFELERTFSIGKSRDQDHHLHTFSIGDYRNQDRHQTFSNRDYKRMNWKSMTNQNSVQWWSGNLSGKMSFCQDESRVCATQTWNLWVKLDFCVKKWASVASIVLPLTKNAGWHIWSGELCSQVT